MVCVRKRSMVAVWGLGHKGIGEETWRPGRDHATIQMRGMRGLEVMMMERIGWIVD